MHRECTFKKIQEMCIRPAVENKHTKRREERERLDNGIISIFKQLPFLTLYSDNFVTLKSITIFVREAPR